MAASGDFVEGVAAFVAEAPARVRRPLSRVALPAALPDRMPAALRVRAVLRAAPLGWPPALSWPALLLPAGPPTPACSRPRAAARRTRTTSASSTGSSSPSRSIDLRGRRGRAALLGAEVPRQEGRRRGADPRQHAPRGRLDGRRRADPRRPRDRHVPQARRHPATRRTPAPTAYPVTKGGTLVAAGAKQRLPAQRQVAEHLRQRPAVHLALHVSGRRRTTTSTRLQLHGDGRPHEHDRHARHPRAGRRPLVVDPEARRQVRRGPRLHELHMVQEPRTGRARLHAASAPSSAAAATRT